MFQALQALTFHFWFLKSDTNSLFVYFVILNILR